MKDFKSLVLVSVGAKCLLASGINGLNVQVFIISSKPFLDTGLFLYLVSFFTPVEVFLCFQGM